MRKVCFGLREERQSRVVKKRRFTEIVSLGSGDLKSVSLEEEDRTGVGERKKEKRKKKKNKKKKEEKKYEFLMTTKDELQM